MSNYREQNAPGIQWTRCPRIIIDNPLEATKTVRFAEETVVSLNGTTIIASLGDMFSPIDMDIDIPILDHETDAPTENTFKPGDMYWLLYSAYIYYATARDTAIALAAQQAKEAQVLQEAIAKGTYVFPVDTRSFVDIPSINSLP
jgi:nucleoid-associated protein YgaU